VIMGQFTKKAALVEVLPPKAVDAALQNRSA
jgi:hypothetical protein